MSRLRRATWMFGSLIVGFVTVAALAQNPDGGLSSISENDLRQWLRYVASDQLGGRATFSEGLALTSGYIVDHLREWDIKPGGDNGTFFQQVPVLGVKTTNRSTLTVEVGGERRVFKTGAGIEFPANVGARRSFTVGQVEFLGYGLSAPFLDHDDYAGRDVAGKVVVWLGARGPNGVDPSAHRRLLSGRNRLATEQMRAAAVIGPEMPRVGAGGAGRQGGPSAAGRRGGGPPQAGPGRAADAEVDFTTVQRLDRDIPPAVTGSDEFFEFLFQGSGTSYAALKARVEQQEPLPSVTLANVTLTFDLDADYEVVRTQYTHNVVGIIEGADPALRNTYVALGAHHDHVGYATGPIVDSPDGPRRQGAPGRVKEGAIEDIVWNGADDDGSGTVTMMAVARAFALGPKPKRSLVFVWHGGEERGLWGSRYFADYSPMPLGAVVAQLNLDMVGRNRDDDPGEANTVYIVGSDRISTELHNLGEDANDALSTPLALDYELNDPADPESIYTRSDHYSYAVKGIPIIFYTTGLHPDYHTNQDEVDRINFEKMARIGQLVYETARRVADLDHAPVRDNRGPRAGKGSTGKLSVK